MGGSERAKLALLGLGAKGNKRTWVCIFRRIDHTFHFQTLLFATRF